MSSKVRRLFAVLALAAAALTVAPTGSVTAAGATNPGLTALNELRALSGLPAVSEDAEMTDGARRHSEYMVRTGTMTHSEDPSSQWYSPQGDLAARQSNLAVFGSSNVTARDAVELLMVSPFHGIAFVDPALSTSGAALFSDSSADRFRSGFTINVNGGRTAAAPSDYPVLWPGHQSQVDLLTYPGGEYPDPLASCGNYEAPSGTPLLLLFDTDRQLESATVTDDLGRTLDACAFDRYSYTNPDGTAQDAGRQALASRNAMVVVPRAPLEHGRRYNVEVATSAGDVQWSFTTTDDQATAPPSEPVERVAGSDRIATSIEVSRTSFLVAPTVVIARADQYADALAGAPLAYQANGPVLLTGRDGLDPAVGEEVRRLGAVRAILLGGEAALSEQVERDLRARGVVDVDRISGADRFEVAARIAERIGGQRAFVVEGANADPARGWPDAVSAGAVAARAEAPILFATRDLLPDATRRALTTITDATVVGGPVAISQQVVERIRGTGVDRVTRVSGADRYDTSTALADIALEGDANADNVWLATGRNWPDALSAGPAVAALGKILVLVDGTDKSGAGATYSWLNFNATNVDAAVVVGGPTVITYDVAGTVGYTISAD